jgi:hypothetical protein
MNIAQLVSVIFEPSVVMVVLSVIAGSVARLPALQYFLYLIVIGITVAIITCARVYFARKFSTNFDLSDQAKRKKIVWYLLFVVGILFYIILLFHNARLYQVFLVFLVWSLGYTIVTQFVKISGHIGILTFFVYLMMQWFGIGWWPMVLCIPLVAWSRLVLKRHTRTEIIGGFLYSVLIFISYETWIRFFR